MTPYAVYDSAGRIIRSGVCQEADTLLQASANGEQSIEVDAVLDDSRHWIDGGTPAPRPSMELSVSHNPFRIDGIPAGAEVMYPGGTVVVNDGFVEWSSVTPGVFEFRVSLFPYKEEVVYADFSNV